MITDTLILKALAMHERYQLTLSAIAIQLGLDSSQLRAIIDAARSRGGQG
jgi:hypothetical protein